MSIRRTRVARCWSSSDPSDVDKLEPKPDGAIRIVCLSDTHGLHKRKVPHGDILIHGAQLFVRSSSSFTSPLTKKMTIVAGDFCNQGSAAEVEAFVGWFGTLPHPHKLVIAGNHDYCLESSSQRLSFGTLDMEASEAKERLRSVATYLENEKVEVLGLRFFASPYNIGHGAFAFPQGHKALENFWASAPVDIDILITHGPSSGARGLSRAGKDGGDVFVRSFTERARDTGLVAHISGHIHESYGVSFENDIYYLNAALAHRAAPIVLDIILAESNPT
jgi:hypothetical protein